MISARFMDFFYRTAIFRHCEGVLVLARSNLKIMSEIASPPKNKSGGSQ